MSPEIYEWLGRWEGPVYFGKHDKWSAVYTINGYLYSADRNGNLYSLQTKRLEPSWSMSPQVRIWMEKPKAPFLKRMVRKLGGWLRTGRWEA